MVHFPSLIGTKKRLRPLPSVCCAESPGPRPLRGGAPSEGRNRGAAVRRPCWRSSFASWSKHLAAYIEAALQLLAAVSRGGAGGLRDAAAVSRHQRLEERSLQQAAGRDVRIGNLGIMERLDPPRVLHPHGL